MACDKCGEPVEGTLPFTCNYCGGEYCEDHQTPETHHCDIAFRETILWKNPAKEKRPRAPEETPTIAPEYDVKTTDVEKGKKEQRRESEQEFQADTAVCDRCGAETPHVTECDHCSRQFCFNHHDRSDHACRGGSGSSDGLPPCLECGETDVDRLVRCGDCENYYCQDHYYEHGCLDNSAYAGAAAAESRTDGGPGRSSVMATSVKSSISSIGHTAFHLGRLLVYVAIVLAVIFGIFGVPGGFGVHYDGVISDVGGDPPQAANEYNESKVEEIFIDKLNARRRFEGKQLVSQRDALTKMAESHSENMAKHDYLGHTEPDGTTVEDRFRDRGLLPECKLPTKDGRYYLGGENAALASVNTEIQLWWGSGSMEVENERDLAEYLFQTWMHSEPHRKAMMLYSADEVGLGLAFDGETAYATLNIC